jgi:uncharacterized protein YegP (UPF0339 family)
MSNTIIFCYYLYFTENIYNVALAFINGIHPLMDWNGGKYLRVEYWLSGRNGLWYFHIVESNGKTNFMIDGHLSKESCLKSIDTFIRNSGNAEVRELMPMINHIVI